MAAPPEANLTRCPYCGEERDRVEVHRHLVDEHLERVETWTDARTGRMHYRIECPDCDAAHEHRVKPRSRDRSFLEVFRREIAMVAFDMLLNHMEASHGEEAPEEPVGDDAERRLPAFGPAGGTGRPGEGVPLPPGMDPAPPSPIPGHKPRKPRIVQGGTDNEREET